MSQRLDGQRDVVLGGMIRDLFDEELERLMRQIERGEGFEPPPAKITQTPNS